MKPELIIIVAMGKQNQIGLKGVLPWHLSNDLKNFKKTTIGHTLIMGRKTFKSINKALPNRMNFVLTKNSKRVSAFEICLFDSLEKALKRAKLFDNKIFIIGGSSVYKQTLNLADKLIITHVDYEGEADVYFPTIKWNEWKKIRSKNFFKDEKNDYDFEIATYIKK